MPLENDGMDCQADIPDLEPGLDYLVRVSAVNAQGPSPPSEPGEASLTPSLPDAARRCLEDNGRQIVRAAMELSRCWTWHE